ncbi:MAG: aldehyde dehydrogenase family protein [Nevskia sp.]|nr:aldehyde dehydrogenase family protein [Nevskia sp.]
MNTAVSYLPSPPAEDVEAEIRRVFERQLATALRLRGSTCQERLARITRLKESVLAHTADLYRAGEADFRKPPAEIDLTEIMPVLAEANDARRRLRKWMKPTRVWPTRATIGSSGWVQYQPRGRCLIVSPWNYPVNLTFGPLISAIAAGNTAILKPSEMTPQLSALMCRIVREVFPEDEVAIFEGDGKIAQALLDLPFDHIFYTGSTAVGKIVMAAAARHLSSVTLELGGKSPTIVDASADLKGAACNIVWSKFTNSGQTCIAPDHIFVHAQVKDEFVRHCRQALETFYGADAAAQRASPYLARVVNQRHTARIKGLLDDAVARGARTLAGGAVDEASCYISPTLLDNVPADARVMREEIFGPLLPIAPFTDIDEVIRQINADPKPLALYVWSRTAATIDKVTTHTSSGGMCINNTVVQFLQGNLPFGGVNYSGIGNAHGHYGFKTFSHERGVVRTRVALASMFYPPYTDFTRRLIRLLVRSV